jgi:AraC-like DNA-binding protein
MLARRHDLSIIGPLGVLAEHCSTIGEALELFCLYYRIQSQGTLYRLETHGETTFLIREGLIAEYAYHEQLQDLSLCEINGMLRYFCGRDWRPSVVCFTRSAPKPARLYRRTFDTRLLYEQDIQAIAFPVADLDRSMVSANELVKASAQSEVEKQAATQLMDLKARVVQIVQVLLPTTSCNVEDVSAHLAMHSRTLHRNLLKQGTSFSEIVDTVRLDTARSLLATTNLSLTKIAAILGYAETASFTRAFRRWLKTSPSGWRKVNRVQREQGAAN